MFSFKLVANDAECTPLIGRYKMTSSEGFPSFWEFPAITAPPDVNKMEEELEQLFEKAANHLKSLVGKLETEQLLYFYARFKQVCQKVTKLDAFYF